MFTEAPNTLDSGTGGFQDETGFGRGVTQGAGRFFGKSKGTLMLGRLKKAVFPRGGGIGGKFWMSMTFEKVWRG